MALPIGVLVSAARARMPEGDPQERLGAQRALEQLAKDLEVMADFAGRPADDEDGE